MIKKERRKEKNNINIIIEKWNLPFGVPACSITAKYMDTTEVEILIEKGNSILEDGEQEIYSYELKADESKQNDRLKLEVEQSQTDISFTTNPCSCGVNVNVKIIDNMIISFEGVYTEVSSDDGKTVTKTITRKEKVSINFITKIYL